jgi:hypothetical protein
MTFSTAILYQYACSSHISRNNRLMNLNQTILHSKIHSQTQLLKGWLIQFLHFSTFLEKLIIGLSWRLISSSDSPCDSSSQVSTRAGGSNSLELPALFTEMVKTMKLTFFYSESPESLLKVAFIAFSLEFLKLGQSVLTCPKPEHPLH